MTIDTKTKKKIKKRFIFLGAILLILGIIAFDKVTKHFAELNEQKQAEHFEQVIEDADSTLLDIDNRLIYLYEQEERDQHIIDSLSLKLKTEDSLSKEEKSKLMNEINELSVRRDAYNEEIVTLSVNYKDSVVVNTTTITITEYDTVYIDTVVYNYTYIDSTIYVMDTVVKADTLIIDNEKDVNKILKKYNK